MLEDYEICNVNAKKDNDQNNSPTGLRRELDVTDFDEDVGVTAVGVKTDGDLAGVSELKKVMMDASNQKQQSQAIIKQPGAT
ncbi:hypothetical protein pdam_00021669 [Pocillopora damicornis]|uniref:Uncharacterized protein n=1 Tax=Pocillopora damicornis TaxID=46731 RepID=A0A3M6ULC5_POCDA|nr:hypothetical protein pdam_00021669 [Pocillopora damicornis]